MNFNWFVSIPSHKETIGRIDICIHFNIFFHKCEVQDIAKVVNIHSLVGTSALD